MLATLYGFRKGEKGGGRTKIRVLVCFCHRRLTNRVRAYGCGQRERYEHLSDLLPSPFPSLPFPSLLFSLFFVTWAFNDLTLVDEEEKEEKASSSSSFFLVHSSSSLGKPRKTRFFSSLRKTVLLSSSFSLLHGFFSLFLLLLLSERLSLSVFSLSS